MGQATVFAPAPGLGTAAGFGAFSGASAGITNQGTLTKIHGSMGTNGASTTITGFTDAVTNIPYTPASYTGPVYGGIYTSTNAGSITTEVLSDIQSAYDQIKPSALTGGYDVGLELGGQTLTKGVYASATSYSITGADLTLDAANDSNAVWIFQAGSSLTVGTATVAQTVVLKNGAQAKNVFWYVGSAAVINYGGGGTMCGTIISSAASTISHPGVAAVTVLNGRIFALNAAVTMVNTVINTDNIWTGAISTDWFNTGNWSTSTVPISSDDVLIPSVPNNPTISGGIALAYNLTIYNAATVTDNSSLQFGGSITDTNQAAYDISKTGILNATAGTIIMNGSFAQTIPAATFSTNTIQNLTIHNSAGVSLGGALKITGIVIPATGTFSTGGYLTIAPGAAIISGYNHITGNVTLQQNIIGQRGWRAFANPFTTATNIPAVASNNGIAINTALKNGMTDAQIWNAIQGKWNYVTASSWAANTMYGLFIRGLATQVTGINYSSPPSPFIYSVSGTLNGNSISITPNDPSQFTMVGNPYAAPVNSQALTGQTSSYYYTYQITKGADAAAQETMQGSWVYASALSNITNTIPVLGVAAYQSSNTTPYTVSTSDINNGGTVQTGLFGFNPPANQLELQVEQNGYFLDKVLVQQDSTITTANFNNKTLQKFYNTINNLYSITANGTDMAIDTRSQLSTVPLGMYALPGNYSFRVNTNSMPQGTAVYLNDSLLHTQTILKQDSTYNFTITADTTTYGEHRFSLLFSSKQTATVSSDSSIIIWTGAVSTAWTDPGNWNLSLVPALNSNVEIPSGPANYPILNSTVSVASVVIGANDYLTVSGTNTLTATGGITVQPNGGLIAASGNINAAVSVQQAISSGAGWRFMNNPFAGSLNLQTVASNNANNFTASNNVVWSTQQNRWVYNSTTIPANTPFALYQHATANGYTLTESGILNTASVTYTPYINGTDTSWMFAGNPYASAVNSAALTGQTLGIPYYQWDVPSQTWIVNLASDQNTAIPVLSSIAYWPWNNNSYSVTIADMHQFKNGGRWDAGLFGAQPSLQYIELEADRDTVYQDKMFLRTDGEATPNGLAIHDLRKMTNTGFNLYSIGLNGKQLAVNAQSAWQDTLSIGMAGAAGIYQLKVNKDNLLSSAADAYLLDGLTNTKTLLATGMIYSFEMGIDSVLNRDRFKIVFSSNKQNTTADSSSTSGKLSVRVFGNVNTSGVYQVEVSNANAGQATLTVHDLDGNVISRISAVNGMNKVQTGNKPAGMYILEVSDGKSRVLAKLIKL